MDLQIETQNSLGLKAKVICSLGTKLAQTGAETRLVLKSMYEMSSHLGIQEPEINYYRDSIQVLISSNGLSAYSFKSVRVHGFNLLAVTNLSHICDFVKQGKLTDLEVILHKIENIKIKRYNQWLLVVMEALAAAGFAYNNLSSIASSDLGAIKVLLSALFGGCILMLLRIWLTKRGFFETFTFMIVSFVGASSAGALSTYVLHATTTETSLAALSTCLLLVPGFPIINGFLDLFKGYILNGLTRLATGFVLIMFATIGLLCAFKLFGV